MTLKGTGFFGQMFFLTIPHGRNYLQIFLNMVHYAEIFALIDKILC